MRPVEEHTVQSASGEYVRHVWIMPGPQDREHPLAVLLDGEVYLEKMEALPIIEELEQSGAIPEMPWVFVSYFTVEARSEDLAGNDRYSRFIAEDVVGWARGRMPTLAAGGHLIGGLSLSGLASAYLAFHYPAIFSRVLCQSGSFWNWEDRDISLPPNDGRFWLSVGDKETQTEITHQPSGIFQRVSQIEGVKNAAERFENLGAKVRYRHFGGGHTVAAWQEDLGPGLKWLFSGR